MGEVYKARDTRLERTVAIKVLPPHLAEDPDRKARFEREARAISRLSHPHICTLYDLGHEGGVDYLVMECLEGETLAERLREGTLSGRSTGQRPGAGATKSSLSGTSRAHEPTPMTRRAPMSLPALGRFTRPCPEKDPDERCQTIHDVVTELKWIRETAKNAVI